MGGFLWGLRVSQMVPTLSSCASGSTQRALARQGAQWERGAGVRSVAAGVRSRKGPASQTPPGGVPGKSHKGARPSALFALLQEPPRARLPLPPGASEGKCGPPAAVGSAGGSPGQPRAPHALACAAVGGRRPSFLKASGRSWNGAAQRWGGAGAGGRGPGQCGGGLPRRGFGERPRLGARRTPRALGALWPRSGETQPAGVATGSAPSCPRGSFCIPLAPRSRPLTPAGRARRLAKPAPSPAAPAPRATPPGPSALRPSPSPSPAARYFHTSQCPGPGA